MKKDERQKALVLFNFAGLNKEQMTYIKVRIQEKYPKHAVFIDGKYFKTHKYDFNWYTLTVEPTLDGVSINHSDFSGVKTVLLVKKDLISSL